MTWQVILLISTAAYLFYVVQKQRRTIDELNGVIEMYREEAKTRHLYDSDKGDLSNVIFLKDQAE